MEQYCATYSSAEAAKSTSFAAGTEKRLFGFGSLPLVPGIAVEEVLKSIALIKSLPHLRGVVMGTKGVGKGLDDPAMEKIWEAIAEAGLVVFVVSPWHALDSEGCLEIWMADPEGRVAQHPHYGVEGAFGEQDNGHVLALGLGFPFETTIVSGTSLRWATSITVVHQY